MVFILVSSQLCAKDIRMKKQSPVFKKFNYINPFSKYCRPKKHTSDMLTGVLKYCLPE